MYGNKYDTDVTVWSPEGKLHQVKYAAEAEKQGSACCGIRTNKYVVLSAFRRRPNELASYQKKIVEVDTHMGMAMSGLTADARALSKYMRTECMEHEYIYGRKMPIEMLVRQVSDKEHFCTLTYERRPYGVGFLIAGVDSKGPHLFHTSPSGEYVEYSATAIGSRCQSAKTYLAREFLDAETNTVHVSDDLSVEELIRHALKALKGCIQGDSKLTKENCSVAIVGVDQDFKELSEEELSPYVEAVAALWVCWTNTTIAPLECPSSRPLCTPAHRNRRSASPCGDARRGCRPHPSVPPALSSSGTCPALHLRLHNGHSLSV